MTLVWEGKLDGYDNPQILDLQQKTEIEAIQQKFRELHIGILNLMPFEFWEDTETEWLSNLDNDEIQIVPHFIAPSKFKSINPKRDERINKYYENIDQVKDSGLDLLIVTGANVSGGLDDAEYGDEIKDIISWARRDVTTTVYSCWSAHACLDYLFGIKKELQDKKVWGIFEHQVLAPIKERHSLVKGLDRKLNLIHSRNNGIPSGELNKIEELEILIEGLNGWATAIGRGGREVYLQSHLEYLAEHLHGECERDKKSLNFPENYYEKGHEGDINHIEHWPANSTLFFRNLINFVYQNTGYGRHEPLEEGKILY